MQLFFPSYIKRWIVSGQLSISLGCSKSFIIDIIRQGYNSFTQLSIFRLRTTFIKFNYVISLRINKLPFRYEAVYLYMSYASKKMITNIEFFFLGPLTYVWLVTWVLVTSDIKQYQTEQIQSMPRRKAHFVLFLFKPTVSQ